MSEPASAVADERPIANDLAAQLSAGKMLQAARLAQGLHIAALAVSLKVPVKKLEALEADQFDLLPDTVFVRALAASVCRTLKIDPAAVLERLPSNSAPHLKADESGINVAFRAAENGAGMSFRDQLSKPVVLAVLLLVVGVVVLLFFPVTPATKLAQAPKSQFNAGSIPVAEAASAPATVENALVAQALTTAPAASLALENSEVLLTGRPMIPASSAPLSGQASAPVPVVPAATTGLLVIKARGSSWVEVLDANKVVQIRKTLGSGEVVAASGAMPLSVVVGRVDTVEVQVRGKPLDLSGLAKDNVARFEVR